MRKICFATNNHNKLAEIQSLLEGKAEILSLEEIGCQEDLPETQDTVQGNSAQKAEFVYNKYKISCFADDTGLEVEALNGEPGVYSARYAGEDCDPEENMNLVLSKLEGKENRHARFITVITLIIDDKKHQFVGKVNGEITHDKMGNEGFGYDPIFMPEDYSITFAEMNSEEKNAISHRGAAAKKLAEYLNKLS